MRKLLFVLLASLLVTGCTSAPTDDNATSTPNTDTFTVGMECNYAPFNWTTLDENESTVAVSSVDYCDGYDVVIAQHIADELGKELVIKKMSWDGLEPAVNSGEIDAIIAGMTNTPERAANADFTNPYYESEMVMIVRKDSEYASATSLTDFNGATVLGQINTMYDDVIDQIEGVDHAVPLANYPVMIFSLQSKDADALTAELPVALGAVAANDDLAIVHFDEGQGFVADTTVSIGLSLGNELVAQINEILANLSEETRTQIMLDAQERQPSMN